MQGEVGRTSAAEPEVFALARFAAIAVEAGVEILSESFRQEQFAFVKRSEGNSTPGVRAFLKHGLDPVFSAL